MQLYEIVLNDQYQRPTLTLVDSNLTCLMRFVLTFINPLQSLTSDLPSVKTKYRYETASRQ